MFYYVLRGCHESRRVTGHRRTRSTAYTVPATRPQYLLTHYVQYGRSVALSPESYRPARRRRGPTATPPDWRGPRGAEAGAWEREWDAAARTSEQRKLVALVAHMCGTPFNLHTLTSYKMSIQLHSL